MLSLQKCWKRFSFVVKSMPVTSLIPDLNPVYPYETLEGSFGILNLEDTVSNPNSSCL